MPRMEDGAFIVSEGTFRGYILAGILGERCLHHLLTLIVSLVCNTLSAVYTTGENEDTKQNDRIDRTVVATP